MATSLNATLGNIAATYANNAPKFGPSPIPQGNLASQSGAMQGANPYNLTPQQQSLYNSAAALGGSNPPANSNPQFQQSPFAPTLDQQTAGLNQQQSNASDLSLQDLSQLPPPQTSNNTGLSGADKLMQAYLSSLTPTAEETALQQQQIALQNASQQLGINQGISNTNIEGQAIPLGEVTGQEANVAKQYQLQQQTLGNKQQTVQAQLALQQAKRQSGIDVAKAGLDYTQKQSEINKPFSVPLGSSVYNPATGQSTGGVTAQDEQAISDAINSGTLDPSQITRYNLTSILTTLKQDPTHSFTGNAVAFNQAKQNSAQWHQDAFGNWFQTQTKPGATAVGSGATTSAPSSPTTSNNVGYKAGQLTALLNSQGKPTDDSSLAAMYKAAGLQGNYVNDVAHNSQLYASLGGSASLPSNSGGTSTFPRADANSLKKQQEYADSTQRAFNTANANLKALIPFMQKAGVNNASTIPLINSIQKAVNGHILDAGTIAAYQAALAGLRAEYAQVLSRGGEVTEGQRSQAASLIPDNLTPAQLQQVADRLNIEGTNAVAEANQQIQIIKNRAQGILSNPNTGTDINALRAKYAY